MRCNLVFVCSITPLPELASCSKCGKQVLTSRYLWSEYVLLCKACAEVGPEFEPGKLKSISMAEQRELQDPKEIVVTWFLLLKASICIAAGLGVIVVAVWGILSLKERAPSAPALSPLKIESVKEKQSK